MIPEDLYLEAATLWMDIGRRLRHASRHMEPEYHARLELVHQRAFDRVRRRWGVAYGPTRWPVDVRATEDIPEVVAQEGILKTFK